MTGQPAFALLSAYFSVACEAEPSDALRQQTDPLEPAGRRFANFFFEQLRVRGGAERRAPPADRPRLEPAGRRFANLPSSGAILFRDIPIPGRTMELGRSGRTLPMMMVCGGRGAGELRGHRQQAALKDQRFRGRVPPLYPLTRAREVDSATCWGRHLAAVADSIFEQFGSGPRRSLRRSAERPARAAWAALRLLADVAIGATMELGRSWRTLR